MSKIDDITNVFILLISLGTSLRIVYLSFMIMLNPDEKDSYINKIKNTAIALILSISVFSIKEIAKYYFG